MTQISVFNMIYDTLVADYTRLLYDEPDDLKVTVIRGGNLQDDPTKLAGLNVLINHSSEGGKLMNMAKSNREDHFMASPHYIGGALTTETTFRVDMVFHFKTKDRDEARTSANILFSRVLNGFVMTDVPLNPNTGNVRDDFGYVIIGKEIFDYRFQEEGGPGQFIWKGVLRGKFFIESPTIYSLRE